MVDKDHGSVQFITKRAVQVASGGAQQLRRQAYSQPGDEVYAAGIPGALARLDKTKYQNKATRMARRMLNASPGSPGQVNSTKWLAKKMAEEPEKFKEFVTNAGMDAKDLRYHKRQALNNPRLQQYLTLGSAERSKVLGERYKNKGKGQGAVVNGMRIPLADTERKLDDLRADFRRQRNLYDTAQDQEPPQFASGVQAFGEFLKGDNDINLGDVVKSFVT